MNKKTAKYSVITLLFLIVSAFLTLFLSSDYSFDVLVKLINGSMDDLDKTILKLRLFRFLSAFIIGGALSVSGMTFQALTRNPLAEPYLLGTSSGAGLGLCIGIYFGLVKVMGYWSLMVLAFTGALVSIFLVFSLSIFKGKSDPIRLILAGVIIGSIFSAIMVFLLSISKTSEFHGIMGWFLGDLEIFDPNLILIISIVTLSIYMLIVPTIKYLDVISLGDTSALSLGVGVEKIRGFYFVLISILVAVTVSVSGLIGFVGLIVPHIFRRLIGPKHKVLFLFSILGGGTFLVICELISRFLVPGMIIPIGVVTALIGGPYFLTLLRKRSS